MSSSRAFTQTRRCVTLRSPCRREQAGHSTCVAYVAKEEFVSIIPDVLEEIELDGDYQAMVESTLAQGQAALTQLETAKRQAVLKATGIQPWAQKMEVCSLLRHVVAQHLLLHLETSRHDFHTYTSAAFDRARISIIC